MPSLGLSLSALIAASSWVFIRRASSLVSHWVSEKNLADSAAGKNFLDVVAAILVLIEIDMHLVHATEEVVHVAHDVLIRTDEKEADIVRLAGLPAVERKRFFYVLEIDKFADLAVRVTGDVDERGVAVGKLVQPMDRHDRKELAERPVVEKRLEDGKIAEELIAESDFHFLHFLGNVAHATEHLDDLSGDLPIDGLNTGFGG